MKICIQKNAKPLRNGNLNPKVPTAEWWGELMVLLEGNEVKILPNKLTWDEMKEMLDWCDTWISVDTYWQHFAWLHQKPGVVIFSQSDPEIFGHEENINLLKDVRYLRPNQFSTWEDSWYNEEAFISPTIVCQNLKQHTMK